MAICFFNFKTFGISRKTFYKWLKRYNRFNLLILESQDKAPKVKRRREITPNQELRIIQPRKQYIRYGKEKISRIYQDTYQESISSWKIQKIIEKHNLYYHPQRLAKIRIKKQGSL